MVSSRRSGRAARGSMFCASSPSSVVTETPHGGQPLGRHRGKDVEVAGDQPALGHDRDRVIMGGQHLEDRARDLQPSFNGLIGVGVGAHGDGARLDIPGLRQFAGPAVPRHSDFAKELRLEIQSG